MDKTPLKYDVLIIGGGPAGMAAALWCGDLGLTSIVIEKESEPGGQLLRTYNPINNYPGVRTENGREMRDIFAAQLGAAKYSASVTAIDVSKLTVTLADGLVVFGHAIIIATGVRRRRLGIPSEKAFAGRGIFESGVASREAVKGKSVVIAGGGDAALENALILAENASSVTLLHRSDNFSARDEFMARAVADPKITITRNTTLTKINGRDVVESVDVVDTKTGVMMTIQSDAVLIRIGVEPNSEFVAGEVILDERGYIVTGKTCMTNVPFVFAIGDVANPAAPTISGAVGDAATAVKAAFSLLKASKTL